MNLSCGRCNAIRSFSGTPPACDMCGWVYATEAQQESGDNLDEILERKREKESSAWTGSDSSGVEVERRPGAGYFEEAGREDDLESRLGDMELRVNDLESKLSRPDAVKSRVDELESKTDDLESKLDEFEQGATTAAYTLGAVIAAILSWSSSHAVGWAILAALCSWLYVIYYVIVHWAEVKIF